MVYHIVVNYNIGWDGFTNLPKGEVLEYLRSFIAQEVIPFKRSLLNMKLVRSIAVFGTDTIVTDEAPVRKSDYESDVDYKNALFEALGEPVTKEIYAEIAGG